MSALKKCNSVLILLMLGNIFLLSIHSQTSRLMTMQLIPTIESCFFTQCDLVTPARLTAFNHDTEITKVISLRITYCPSYW